MSRTIGESPDDLLGFLVASAPNLASWQRHILKMLHQEARYFWPQQLTKVGNEGYATFWHRKIVHNVALESDEAVEIARMNAELVQVRPPQLNPYRLGYVLVGHAQAVDGSEGLRRIAGELSDMGLVREYLDAEAIRLAGLGFARVPLASTDPEGSWVEVKRRLLADLDHAGLPRMLVDASRSVQTGCLHLHHEHTGRDLDVPMLGQALRLIAEQIWQGEVILRLQYHGGSHRLHHDGHTFHDELVQA